MFGGFFFLFRSLSLSLSHSRRYLHIKTSMWELLAHRVYSAHKGVFYCELPLIITRSPRRDPLGGGPNRSWPSLCHSPSLPFWLRERAPPLLPSILTSCVYLFFFLFPPNVFLFLRRRPSGRSGVLLQDVLCGVTGSQWEPACAAASSASASLRA